MNYPKTRDDDFLLYWIFIKNKVDKNISLRDSLELMAKKKIPSIQSISRIRRKIQEEAAKEGKFFLCGNRNKKKEKELLIKKQINNGEIDRISW
jgi:hypothetical protein